MKNSHNMQGQGGTYLDRLVKLAADQPENRLAAEAARLRAMMDGAKVPAECGPDIVASPARGGFVLTHNVGMVPVGADGFEPVHRGFGGRAAIRRADVFDRMMAAALRRKEPCPLTPGQIAIARRYHDLVEMLSKDGMKLSQLQGTPGGPDGRDWMDRRLVVSAEVEGIRRRIPAGPAMQIRRVRPVARGGGDCKAFTQRQLVDAVCLSDKSIKDVLGSFGWQKDGRNCKAATEALAAALDGMIGYVLRKSS